MTEVNPNNDNETNSDIFLGHIEIWDHFLLVAKYVNFSMTFIISIFQFYCKSEDKEVKSNGTNENMRVIFLIYKVVHYWNDIWNSFLDKVYLKNEW